MGNRRTQVLIALGTAAAAGLVALAMSRREPAVRGPIVLELDFGVGTVNAAPRAGTVEAPPKLEPTRGRGGRTAGTGTGGGAGTEGTPGRETAPGEGSVAPPPLAHSAAERIPLGTAPAPDARDAAELDRRARLERHYAKVPVSALVEQHRELTRELGVRANELAEQAFRRGEGEAPGPEEVARGGYTPDGRVVRYSRDPYGHKVRVVLSEDAHPDLYALKREADWLYGEVLRRKRQGG